MKSERRKRFARARAGTILKHSGKRVADAIHRVLAGELVIERPMEKRVLKILERPPPLTERQGEIALLVARRLSDEEIAEALCISPTTVKRHQDHIRERLDVRTRFDVAMHALGDASTRPDAPSPHGKKSKKQK
jgi:DNA-binding NarL/FixJ family response regulator